MDNAELKHAVELSFNTTISLLEKAGVSPADDELRKALPEVLSALEAVERLVEALEPFAVIGKLIPGNWNGKYPLKNQQVTGVRFHLATVEQYRDAAKALAATEPKPSPHEDTRHA